MSESPAWLDRFAARGMFPIDGKAVSVPRGGPDSAPTAEMSEKEFMSRVIALAKSFGWKVYHTFSSKRSQPGFPDLCMVRHRIIFAELKTGTGRLTAAQANWLDSIRETGGSAFEWHPKDWEEIVSILRGDP